MKGNGMEWKCAEGESKSKDENDALRFFKILMFITFKKNNCQFFLNSLIYHLYYNFSNDFSY